MQTLLDQLVYFAFFQCLFLLAVVTLSKKQRGRVNPFFLVLTVALLIGLSGRVLYLTEMFGRSTRLLVFSEFATLLFGSTIYLFCRTTLDKHSFGYRDLWHYAPAVVYNLVMVGYFLLPDAATTRERLADGSFFRTVTICVGFGLAFNWLYWGLSLRLFLRFRHRLRAEASHVVRTRFFLWFLLAVGGCLLAWTIAYGISLASVQFIARSTTQIVWLGIALLMLFLAYYGIRQPELYRIPVPVERAKYANSRLSNDELANLRIRLDELMLREKPYLNRRLLKAELATLLGVSSPDLARLLNEQAGMNFFEYVNYYRIKEFVALARSTRARELTLFGLAQEAGFNSKTTFNKAFRELMGSTPGAFLKEQHLPPRTEPVPPGANRTIGQG